MEITQFQKELILADALISYVFDNMAFYRVCKEYRLEFAFVDYETAKEVFKSVKLAVATFGEHNPTGDVSEEPFWTNAINYLLSITNIIR